MATKTFKVSLSLDNPRIIQTGIKVRSFDKQSIKISIELTKNSQVYQIPTGAQIKISLLKLARQEQKIILDVPFTSADSIDWIVPDYLDGYQGEVRVGIYLIVGTENIDVGYFNITSSVSDIDSAAEEFTESVLQGWAIEDLTALLPKFQAVLDETTGKDVISAPEIILARNGEVDLKTRLDKEKQEVTAQLAHKATKEEVDNSLVLKRDKSILLTQNDVTDEFKEQIAGTTAINAVPANGSLIKERFKPSVISPMLTDFVSVGKNLFNKATAIDGYLIMGTGVLTANASYYLSDYIAVSPNTVYGRSYSTTVNYYDSQYNFISQSDRAKTYTTPENCAFVRLNGDVGKKDIDQFELGSTSIYEPFKIKMNDFEVSYDAFDPSLKSTFEDLSSILMPSKNLFNKDVATLERWLNSNTGEFLPETVSNRFTSDFIDVTPNTTYTLSPKGASMTIVFYNSAKEFISSITDSTVVTPPANAVYLRFSSYIDLLNETQVEVGSEVTTYNSYGNKVTPEAGEAIIQPNSQIPEKIYTFNDAWVEWLNGSKFPIAFYGDSTVDGLGTTNFSGGSVGVDNTNPNAFPKKAEEKLIDATGNGSIRVYNAGFSGNTASWGASNMDGVFLGSSPYNDVKMIGIGFGINDRLSYTNKKSFRVGFKNNIETMINWCYDNNIQPFLMTSQAIVSPNLRTTDGGQYPLRTAEDIETVANEVKIELAKEYGLELIDFNNFTEKFLLYSTHSAAAIIPDRLHFGDVGHKYESEMIFAHLSPWTVIVNDFMKIDYSNQRILNGVPEDKLTMPESPSDSFKVLANYVKADTTDTLICRVHLFVDTTSPMTLRAFKSDATSLTYAKVNGVSTNLDTLEKTVSTLDLGLHTLEVWTGVSDKVDFKGFIVE